MPDEIDIKLCDDDDDDEEKIKTEIKRIKNKGQNFIKLYGDCLPLVINSLMIINFTTILFSIFNPKKQHTINLKYIYLIL